MLLGETLLLALLTPSLTLGYKPSFPLGGFFPIDHMAEPPWVLALVKQTCREQVVNSNSWEKPGQQELTVLMLFAEHRGGG
jgi:hypothetical protein